MSNEIEAETIRHLGKVRKPVSPEPIQLTVYSSKVPNLTLVDMPGQRPRCCSRLSPEPAPVHWLHVTRSRAAPRAAHSRRLWAPVCGHLTAPAAVQG